MLTHARAGRARGPYQEIGDLEVVRCGHDTLDSVRAPPNFLVHYLLHVTARARASHVADAHELEDGGEVRHGAQCVLGGVELCQLSPPFETEPGR